MCYALICKTISSSQASLRVAERGAVSSAAAAKDEAEWWRSEAQRCDERASSAESQTAEANAKFKAAAAEAAAAFRSAAQSDAEAVELRMASAATCTAATAAATENKAVRITLERELSELHLRISAAEESSRSLEMEKKALQVRL